MSNYAVTFTELRPCPFCGGLPKRRPAYDGLYKEEIICDDCTAAVKGDSREDVINAWNKRSGTGYP